MGGEPKPEFPALLELGFHVMNVSQLRALCVDRFPDSETRPAIMRGLEEVLKAINGNGIHCEAWIDGSFLTNKNDPEDSDIVVRITNEDLISLTNNQVKILDWINTNLKDDFLCDSYVFVEYLPPHALAASCEFMRAYWMRQFGFSRQDEPKGVVVIKLPVLS